MTTISPSHGETPTHSETEQFIADMVASVVEAKATDKQREIGKAWLRFAITHANRLADLRRRHSEGSSNG